MSVEMLNDVKVYNLSSGKTMPEWLDERQRRRIANSDEFKHRVEIIQDFDFPVGSQCIQISRDNQYVVATGVYKPRVKVFEFAETSLKFERYLDSAVVQFYQVSLFCWSNLLQGRFSSSLLTVSMRFPRHSLVVAN